MKKGLKNIINLFLQPFRLKLVKENVLIEHIGNKDYAKEYKFILNYPSKNASDYLFYKKLSRSQIKQDLFVLMELDFKRNGYFVEFGATDGLSFSNSFILENEFGWNGILAEPAKCWHSELLKNRGCFIEKDCIWSESGKEFSFNETEKAELSTISGIEIEDNHGPLRNKGKKYNITTISLIDLLDKYNAPPIIDYISIDTEGSEYQILQSFNFKKYKFRVISVEHNYSPVREKIYNLLIENGYCRVHTEFSLFHDWYRLKEEMRV
ncbi:FkbM family methyltransferase [Salegentibacter sp. F188]|uniref:FkbM family methyltransferase n=1 Tax=Autumnicola patrickiae TaxID=3075591 RepID=A0ABU3DY11_9FLAO|nr:FkbM family methyltransferase [Salegentibacter sp. F188]MDT0688612.1 FkbM family methyltransferase [Salegentibacter sp. F188]